MPNIEEAVRSSPRWRLPGCVGRLRTEHFDGDGRVVQSLPAFGRDLCAVLCFEDAPSSVQRIRGGSPPRPRVARYSLLRHQPVSAAAQPVTPPSDSGDTVERWRTATRPALNQTAVRQHKQLEARDLLHTVHDRPTATHRRRRCRECRCVASSEDTGTYYAECRSPTPRQASRPACRCIFPPRGSGFRGFRSKNAAGGRFSPTDPALRPRAVVSARPLPSRALRADSASPLERNPAYRCILSARSSAFRQLRTENAAGGRFSLGCTPLTLEANACRCPGAIDSPARRPAVSDRPDLRLHSSARASGFRQSHSENGAGRRFSRSRR